MRYINHKSDFQVIINIKDKEGNVIAPPSVPWEAVFADENGCEFTCYYDGNNYTHCIVDGNDIVCFIDNPGFSCGKLRCIFYQHVPSEEYCDGVMDLTQPLQCDIMLSKRESDDSTPITIEASPNWAKGEQGIQGIQGEKGADGFSPIVSLNKQGTISTLSITDAQGEHTTEIADGAKGDDGFSPIVSLNKVDKVTTLTITDAQGTHTATVNDGESVNVVQSTGTSETAVMSQKAVSDALSNVYTKAESDARYLRGEVLYEDYYYPNMSPTTDTTRFTDSTQILQPTKFIGEYTDESGQKYNCVFECESFPDWFDYAEGACYPYGNGISTAMPFFKNYTIDNGELVYNFNRMQNINIAQKLPAFSVTVGLKKIDDNHFNLYTAKGGTVEFTAFDKANVDCSLFAFGPYVNNLIYDIDDCKRIRVSLIGNFMEPSRYDTLISGANDIGIKSYVQRQVLYGNEYVDYEIDKLNKRRRQIGAGYSMWYRGDYKKNWDQATKESYYSKCTLGWGNIVNGPSRGISYVGGKLTYSFNGSTNPQNILIMGCKIKIEKLA